MANDFFGIQNAMELLGFRTRPLREHDSFTTRLANAGSAQAAAKEQLAVKTFEEFLAEAKEKTADMSPEAYKDYVNEVLASLQAENAQREDFSASTLQNQMQLSSLYINLLQNSLLNTGSSAPDGGNTSSLNTLDLGSMATTALSTLSALNTNAANTATTGAQIANALTNAQTIRPTATADGALTALIASGLLNTDV